MTKSLKHISTFICAAAVITSILTPPGFAMTDEDPIVGSPQETHRPTIRQRLTQRLVTMFPFATSTRYDAPRFSTGNRSLLDILDPNDGRAALPSLHHGGSSTTTAAAPSIHTFTSLPTRWGRMESGNTTGVVDTWVMPDESHQAPLDFQSFTPEQREAFDQHVRLIQCRIKNCCGPKADQ